MERLSTPLGLDSIGKGMPGGAQHQRINKAYGFNKIGLMLLCGRQSRLLPLP